MALLYSEKEFEIGIECHFDGIGGEICYSRAQVKQISLFNRNDKKHKISLSLSQMRIDNKTSRFLSGHYIYFGIVFLIPGLYTLFYLQWLLACTLLFISWFLLATYSGVEIDTDKKQFREYNAWFGVFRSGEWKSLDNFLGITLVSMNQVSRIYSRSNRVNSSTQKEFQVYLVDKNKRPVVAIKKLKTHEEAQRSLDEFSVWLKMPVFSIKK